MGISKVRNLIFLAYYAEFSDPSTKSQFFTMLTELETNIFLQLKRKIVPIIFENYVPKIR